MIWITAEPWRWLSACGLLVTGILWVFLLAIAEIEAWEELPPASPPPTHVRRVKKPFDWESERAA